MEAQRHFIEEALLFVALVLLDLANRLASPRARAIDQIANTAKVTSSGQTI
jgi:hypothetical protein